MKNVSLPLFLSLLIFDPTAPRAAEPQQVDSACEWSCADSQPASTQSTLRQMMEAGANGELQQDKERQAARINEALEEDLKLLAAVKDPTYRSKLQALIQWHYKKEISGMPGNLFFEIGSHSWEYHRGRELTWEIEKAEVEQEYAPEEERDPRHLQYLKGEKKAWEERRHQIQEIRDDYDLAKEALEDR